MSYKGGKGILTTHVDSSSFVSCITFTWTGDGRDWSMFEKFTSFSWRSRYYNLLLITFVLGEVHQMNFSNKGFGACNLGLTILHLYFSSRKFTLLYDIWKVVSFSQFLCHKKPLKIFFEISSLWTWLHLLQKSLMKNVIFVQRYKHSFHQF